MTSSAPPSPLRGSSPGGQGYEDLVIYCSLCFLPVPTAAESETDYRSASRNVNSPPAFWLTSCGHIVCSEHIFSNGVPSRAAETTHVCPYCKASGVSLAALGIGEVPAELRDYFRPESDLLDDLSGAIKFRTNNLVRIAAHYKKLTKTLETQLAQHREVFTRVKDELVEAKKLRKNYVVMEKKVTSLSQEVADLRAQIYTAPSDPPQPAHIEISSSPPPTRFEASARRPEKRRAVDDGSSPPNRAREFRNEMNKRQAIQPPIRPPMGMPPPPPPPPIPPLMPAAPAQRRGHEREGGWGIQGQSRGSVSTSYRDRQASQRAATAGSAGRSQQFLHPPLERQGYGRPPSDTPMRAGHQSYPGPSRQIPPSRIETPRHPAGRFTHPSLRAGSAFPQVRPETAHPTHPTQRVVNPQNPGERLGTGMAANRPFKPHFPQPPEYASSIARGQREDYVEPPLNRRLTGAAYRGNVVPQPLWEDALRTPAPTRRINPTQMPPFQRSGVGPPPRYDGDWRAAQPGVTRGAEGAGSVISPFFSGSPPPGVASNQNQPRGQASVVLPRGPTFSRYAGPPFRDDPRDFGFETPAQGMYRSRGPTPHEGVMRGEVRPGTRTQTGVGSWRQGMSGGQRGGRGTVRLGDLLRDDTRGGNATISGGPGSRQSVRRD